MIAVKDKIYYIIFIIVVIYYSIFNTYDKPAVEELEIPSYVSVDIQKKGDESSYPIGVNTYVFQEDGDILVKYREGVGKTPVDARQKRQLREDKQYIIGQEKMYVISEETARLGIKSYIDLLFTNNLTNDKALVAISKEKASDILKYASKEYSDRPDYLEGIVKTIDNLNFYSEENTVFDVYSRLTAKARNLVLPYIEITGEGLKVTGTAVFKDDKMLKKIEGEDVRVLNMLREKSGRGTITLSQGENKYIDIYGKPKRKVKCWKENDKLKFLINIDFKGEVITNTLSKKLNDEYSTKKQIEHMAEKRIENLANDFISKMKLEYKLDCINLGRVAAAKYGKNSVEDWNEAILNSEIYIKAKVNITKQGRGGY